MRTHENRGSRDPGDTVLANTSDPRAPQADFCICFWPPNLCCLASSLDEELFAVLVMLSWYQRQRSSVCWDSDDVCSRMRAPHECTKVVRVTGDRSRVRSDRRIAADKKKRETHFARRPQRQAQLDRSGSVEKSRNRAVIVRRRRPTPFGMGWGWG